MDWFQLLLETGVDRGLSELNWQQSVSLEESIEKIINWYARNQEWQMLSTASTRSAINRCTATAKQKGRNTIDVRADQMQGNNMHTEL